MFATNSVDTPNVDSSMNPNFSVHPVLRGTSGYRIDQQRITLSIGEVLNPRTNGDISGTLSLELWALKQPYAGGNFQGVAVAGTQIGELFGQYFIGNQQYQLDFTEPPAGNWHLTLMLREWTDAGFVTRDFVNFGNPYFVPWTPTLVANTVANTSVASTAVSDTTAPSRAAVTKQPATAKQPATTKQPATAKQPAAVAKQETASTKKGGNKSDRVSVNSAAADELRAVKGLPPTVADSILAARPFATLDDLLKLKGMGPKLLEKMRKFLSL